MSRSTATEVKTRPEESPIAWFSELLIAIERGEYRRAADVQEQLGRLGWIVRKRSPPHVST